MVIPGLFTGDTSGGDPTTDGCDAGLDDGEGDIDPGSDSDIDTVRAEGRLVAATLAASAAVLAVTAPLLDFPAIVAVTILAAEAAASVGDSGDGGNAVLVEIVVIAVGSLPGATPTP